MPAPPAALLAVAALLGGAAAGVGLERAGVLSPLDEPEAAAEVRREVVDVLDCPEGTVVAALTRGDRIVATGRSDDGAWIEIRSPLGLDDRVWLPAATVAPDGERSALDDLPERGCDQVRPSTTTTSTSTSTTSTTVPETTTTTTEPPPVVTTPSTRPPRTTTTATTLPPDVTPPVVGTIQRNPLLVFDEGINCPANGPNSRSTVSLTVTDDRPGVTVAMTYAFDGFNGPVSGSLGSPTQQGSTFSAVFGPFPAQTAKNGAITNVPITIVATDAAGNQAQTGTFVEFRSCD